MNNSLPMKSIKLLIFLTINIPVVKGQSTEALAGAWTREHHGNQQVLVFTAKYWSFAEFNVENKTFIGTMGGSFGFNQGKFSYVLEYRTDNDSINYNPLMDGVTRMNTKRLKMGANTWNRLDDGTPGALYGAWLITGRERDGKMTTRKPGARKTMKILSGIRFQWIAFNSETMEFRATGGGTYTTEDGKYTERIEFFSRDSSRIGAELGFDYELKNDEWHHSGKSSKGQPIYEVWSHR
jgi:hypothetical protein